MDRTRKEFAIERQDSLGDVAGDKDIAKSLADRSDWPRVLFCTHEIPQSVNAGSMQLYRVLKDYPEDRIMILGPKPEPDAKLLLCRYEELNLLAYRLTCTRFRPWTIGLNSVAGAFDANIAQSLRRARAFRPDVIVTVMDKLSYYKHAWIVAKRLSTPLVAITMDDPQYFESSHPFFETVYRRLLRRIYADTVLSLGVSMEMCDYLKTKFEKKSVPFYFGPPDGLSARDSLESAVLKNPPFLTLAYTGTMALGYRDGIQAIIPALEQTGTRLVLYTREQARLIQHPLIINRGYIPVDQLWTAVKKECDAVILPYSFEDDIAKIYRTHFPTKLSEYCWTGMPVIVNGPAYGTGVRWGRRHPEAVLTAGSFSEVADILCKLRDDSNLRVKLAAKAANIAHQEFDPDIIRARFQRHLVESASMKSNQVFAA